MHVWNKTITAIDIVASRLVWFGGALLILAAATVTVDVLMRKIFSVSMGGSDELSGYAFGISTMLSLAFALVQRANIRVDAFYHHFPKPLRAVADIAGLLLLVSFIALIAYLGFGLWSDSVAFGAHSITPMRVPLAIPQGLWLGGLLFAVFTGVVLIFAGATALWRGDWHRVQAVIGIKSVDEQIDDETE